MESPKQKLRLVGVLGGTFNPIHNGHLNIARELFSSLGLDQLCLVPSARPPHRETPSVDAQTRLQMVQAAVRGEQGLVVEDFEVRRDAVSYTIDTLKYLRQQLGDSVSLCFILGVDAFCELDTWKHWRNLLEYAHLVVVHRPGWHEQEIRQGLSPALQAFLKDHETDSVARLGQRSQGSILFQQTRPKDISSTQVRQCLARGLSIEQLVPPAVAQIISRDGLYREK